MASNLTTLIDENSIFHQISPIKIGISPALQSSTSYLVISVSGPQSSGKSTLLNTLFETDFRTLDVSKGFSRTTRGIEVCCVDDPAQFPLPMLLLDAEGTDSCDRSNEGASVESQLALFSLCVSHCFILNIWMHDLGRFSASNSALFKRVVSVARSSFGAEGRKVWLVFCVRDFEEGRVAEKTVKDSLLDIFRDALKDQDQDHPQHQRGSAAPDLEDLFEVDFLLLPSFHTSPERFEERLSSFKDSLQTKILRTLNSPSSLPAPLSSSSKKNLSGSGAVQQRHGSNAAEGGHGNLPFDQLFEYWGSLWQKIKTHRDLDLPSERKYFSVMKCRQVVQEQAAWLEKKLLLLGFELDTLGEETLRQADSKNIPSLLDSRELERRDSYLVAFVEDTVHSVLVTPSASDKGVPNYLSAIKKIAPCKVALEHICHARAASSDEPGTHPSEKSTVEMAKKLADWGMYRPAANGPEKRKVSLEELVRQLVCFGSLEAQLRALCSLVRQGIADFASKTLHYESSSRSEFEGVLQKEFSEKLRAVSLLVDRFYSKELALNNKNLDCSVVNRFLGGLTKRFLDRKALEVTRLDDGQGEKASKLLDVVPSPLGPLKGIDSWLLMEEELEQQVFSSKDIVELCFCLELFYLLHRRSSTLVRLRYSAAGSTEDPLPITNTPVEFLTVASEMAAKETSLLSENLSTFMDSILSFYSDTISEHLNVVFLEQELKTILAGLGEDLDIQVRELNVRAALFISLSWLALKKGLLLTSMYSSRKAPSPFEQTPSIISEKVQDLKEKGSLVFFSNFRRAVDSYKTFFLFARLCALFDAEFSFFEDKLPRTYEKVEDVRVAYRKARVQTLKRLESFERIDLFSVQEEEKEKSAQVRGANESSKKDFADLRERVVSYMAMKAVEMEATTEKRLKEKGNKVGLLLGLVAVLAMDKLIWIVKRPSLLVVVLGLLYIGWIVRRWARRLRVAHWKDVERLLMKYFGIKDISGDKSKGTYEDKKRDENKEK